MMEFAQPRDYRKRFGPDLSFQIFRYRESDLAVGLPASCWRPEVAQEIQGLLLQTRSELETYLGRDPVFLTTHAPYAAASDAPEIAKTMALAGQLAGVGPMAAVAGAIAQVIGKGLLPYSQDVIVENGGDIFIAGRKEKIVGIFAGAHSPFTGKVGLRLPQRLLPLGVCTSSGTVGPSISYGCADCATILAPDTALADAVATACGNRVQTVADLPAAVEFALAVPGVIGALAIKDDQMAALGEIQLTGLG